MVLGIMTELWRERTQGVDGSLVGEKLRGREEDRAPASGYE
jgi:hypothetical protein